MSRWEAVDRGPYWAAKKGTRVWYANKNGTQREAEVVAAALNALNDTTPEQEIDD